MYMPCHIIVYLRMHIINGLCILIGTFSGTASEEISSIAPKVSCFLYVTGFDRS